jgi:hypothetical protein
MLVGVACAHAPAIQLPPTGSDVYDVYQTVLAFEVERLDRARGVWLLSETRGGEKEGPAEYEKHLRSLKQAAKALPPGAVEEATIENDFWSAYQDAARLPAERIDARRMTVPKEVQLVEKIDGPWWAAPKSVLAFSRVGFDNERQRAVILVDMVCGSLCGGGRIVELRRVGQGWSIVKRIRTWIS